jgi:2-acylglycerol O-acyltransferase 2
MMSKSNKNGIEANRLVIVNVLIDEFGLLPRRKPVYIVIGKPIHVKKVEGSPTTEQLEELQKKYIDEVLEIWERYKDKYAVGRTQELRIIE